MSPLMLTGHDATGHVHLIVGSNPLANARCAKSLAAGARPVVIAPSSSHIHYSLQQKIDNGSVKWLDKQFQDEDVKTLGRSEVDGFVDAVFLTRSGCSTFSEYDHGSAATIC